ncbi:MAG TPA: hypothetical protein VFG86_22740 [Chloroflexota bacterium]|nr:hypothetical protein [Chloroflexota bacterium]
MGEQWAAAPPAGSLLVTTCHRAELYGSSVALSALADASPAGVRAIRGADVAHHLVRVAVGLDSSIVAEDQILHQLRVAAGEARQRGPLTPALDRLVDMALHSGRIARSWMPSRRPTLVDVALSSALGNSDPRGRRFHVVGTGEMGRGAVTNLFGRGAVVSLSSRTTQSARQAAQHLHVQLTDFDPGPDHLAGISGVVVAISGSWALSAASRQSLTGSGAWLVDLSAPPAVDAHLAGSLGSRLSTIDDLARPSTGPEPSARLLTRLEALASTTVDEFLDWAANEERRAAAEALSLRAHSMQIAELERLWRRVPSLDDEQRAEVERAIGQLTQRLLREPLEQLGRDIDGTRARAARELFRL